VYGRCLLAITACPIFGVAQPPAEPLAIFTLELFIVNGVDEWVVARVAHGEKVAAEPNDVDVLVPGK
jgi:hypothetical protein